MDSVAQINIIRSYQNAKTMQNLLILFNILIYNRKYNLSPYQDEQFG